MRTRLSIPFHSVPFYLLRCRITAVALLCSVQRAMPTSVYSCTPSASLFTAGSGGNEHLLSLLTLFSPLLALVHL